MICLLSYRMVAIVGSVTVAVSRFQGESLVLRKGVAPGDLSGVAAVSFLLQQPGPAGVGPPGNHQCSMQPAQANTQQLQQQLPLHGTPSFPAAAGNGKENELLWRYERAQLAYDATVAAAVTGERQPPPPAAAAAAPGVFVLPWARRQPWEWEWQQRQPVSPRARAAADTLMALSGGRL
jgi:hypothetical protein